MAASAVVTQIQFSNISDEKIHQARLDTYRSDLRAFDIAEEALEACVASIDVRDTYRDLFGGVSILFGRTADLPVTLLSESEVALEYQRTLREDIVTYIDTPVAEKLVPKLLADCPEVPPEPVRPER